jgi:hypothetical protein
MMPDRLPEPGVGRLAATERACDPLRHAWQVRRIWGAVLIASRHEV